MEPFTTALLTSLGTNAFVGALGAAYIKFKFDKDLAAHKAQVEHIYNQKLATHSADLDRANELTVAEFKHKLELAASQQSFQFSRVFEKTAKVLEQTYNELIDLNDAVNSLMQLRHTKDIIKINAFARVVETKWNKFETSLKRSRLYISNETAEHIRDFTFKLHDLERKDNWLEKWTESDKINPDAFERQEEKLAELMDTVPKLLNQIRDDFKETLGFPPRKAQDQKPA